MVDRSNSVRAVAASGSRLAVLCAWSNGMEQVGVGVMVPAKSKLSLRASNRVVQPPRPPQRPAHGQDRVQEGHRDRRKFQNSMHILKRALGMALVA